MPEATQCPLCGWALVQDENFDHPRHAWLCPNCGGVTSAEAMDRYRGLHSPEPSTPERCVKKADTRVRRIRRPNPVDHQKHRGEIKEDEQVAAQGFGKDDPLPDAPAPKPHPPGKPNGKRAKPLPKSARPPKNPVAGQIWRLPSGSEAEWDGMRWVKPKEHDNTLQQFTLVTDGFKRLSGVFTDMAVKWNENFQFEINSDTIKVGLYTNDES